MPEKREGSFSGLLKKFAGSRPALRPEVSVSEVLRRLGEIEADAVAYYEALAKHTDLPWVRQFALRLAEAEKGHQEHFLSEAAAAASASGEDGNRLKEPLSEELVQLLSVRLPLPRGIEKTAIYVGEADAVELAINAERCAVRLLTQLRGYVPEAQRGYVDRVVEEERHHQSFLEGLYEKHFGHAAP